MNLDPVITESLARIADQISNELSTLSDDARGTVLANITLRLFRTCERDLTPESFDLLCETLEEEDEPEVMH